MQDGNSCSEYHSSSTVTACMGDFMMPSLPILPSRVDSSADAHTTASEPQAQHAAHEALGMAALAQSLMDVSPLSSLPSLLDLAIPLPVADTSRVDGRTTHGREDDDAGWQAAPANIGLAAADMADAEQSIMDISPLPSLTLLAPELAPLTGNQPAHASAVSLTSLLRAALDAVVTRTEDSGSSKKSCAAAGTAAQAMQASRKRGRPRKHSIGAPRLGQRDLTARLRNREAQKRYAVRQKVSPRSMKKQVHETSIVATAMDGLPLASLDHVWTMLLPK